MNKLLNDYLKNGYADIKLIDKEDINYLKRQISTKLNKSYKNFKIKNLKFFHKKNLTKKEHSILLNPSKRYLEINKKVFNSKKIKSKIGKLTTLYWGHSDYQVLWIGNMKRKEILKDKIGFRVVRPGKEDESGTIHTDSYSRNFDSFITIWIPLIGFSRKYTLRYAKKSQLNSHSKKHQIKQNSHNSKELDKKYVQKFKFLRPDLKPGYGRMHHPNILHGYGKNNGKFTRVSVEIRIFNTKKYKMTELFDSKYFY